MQKSAIPQATFLVFSCPKARGKSGVFQGARGRMVYCSVLGGTGSECGGSGRYLMVQGQHWAVLVGNR